MEQFSKDNIEPIAIAQLELQGATGVMHTHGCPNSMGTHYSVVFTFPKAVTLQQLEHAYPDAQWTQPWRRGGMIRLPMEPHPPFLTEYRDHMLAMRKQAELDEALADVEVECSPMTDMETPPRVIRTTTCPDAQPTSPFVMAGEQDLSLPISISDSYNVTPLFCLFHMQNSAQHPQPECLNCH
eukprot:GHVP01006103.1.p1 GENE.GHVP01006103.1~~GHVP01006103.1.p1  ORF type:complete len:183 (+),score=5.22 GHVP01006103.1:82-630(+)